MEIMEYLTSKKQIQKTILEYIDNDSDIEENFQNLIKLIKNEDFQVNCEELERLLYLIVKISKHHFRPQYFFNKIERILKHIKNTILQKFTNFEIFQIFKSNKRLLLFLFEEKILNPEKSIYDIISVGKYKKFNYVSYFYPEMKQFLTKKNDLIDQMDFIEFHEKRKKGENDDRLCEIIRNDSIRDFIIFVNRFDISLTAPIKESIFETNSFLLKYDQHHLIEYSAFFGSIQIFKYLHLNSVEISPILFFYAVHGDNPEIIHYMEDNKTFSSDIVFRNSLYESIKCHHNEISEYILMNYLENCENCECCDLRVDLHSIKSSNYVYFPLILENEYFFYYLCSCNYLTLVKFLMKTKDIDINKRIILF